MSEMYDRTHLGFPLFHSVFQSSLIHCAKLDLNSVLILEREPLRFLIPLQYLSETFTCSSKVTLPNIRKCIVKVTFPSPSQCLDDSLSESLRSFEGLFSRGVKLNYKYINLDLNLSGRHL